MNKQASIQSCRDNANSYLDHLHDRARGVSAYLRDGEWENSENAAKNLIDWAKVVLTEIQELRGNL